MQKDIVLRKNPDIVTRIIDDETILLPIYKTSKEINCIYTLNNAGSRIWNLINNKRKLSAIKNKILGEFDTTSKDVDKELAVFLKDLKQIKALI